MADIFDGLAGLTLNTKEATQDSELIKVNPYLNFDINKIHGVQTGILMDQFIPILGQFEDIGKLHPGSCGSNVLTDNIPVSEKTWTPKLISARIPMCVDDLPTKMKFWMEAQQASKRWEEINKPLKQFFLDLIAEAVARAIVRIADFGDKGGLVVGDGGYLTADTTITLFTMLDGLWKQIFTDGAGDENIYRCTISENTAGTKAAQLDLADDAAYEVMAALDENLPPEAESGNNVFQITHTIWKNWVRYLENKSGSYKPEMLQDGMTKETFRGRQIIVRKDWDRLIKKYHNLGDTYYLPHRAIITDINNIPVGTSDNQSFTSLDTWFEKKDKTVYTDVAWREDSKLLLEDSIAVAY